MLAGVGVAMDRHVGCIGVDVGLLWGGIGGVFWAVWGLQGASGLYGLIRAVWGFIRAHWDCYGPLCWRGWFSMLVGMVLYVGGKGGHGGGSGVPRDSHRALIWGSHGALELMGFPWD